MGCMPRLLRGIALVVGSFNREGLVNGVVVDEIVI